MKRLPARLLEDLTLDAIEDVDTTTTPPTADDVLKWDGMKWVPADTIDGGTL